MKIRIPKRFFDDHEERELPAPPVKAWRGGYVIDPDHADFAELMDDAKYYADDVDQCDPALKRAARALIKTVAKELAFLKATQSTKGERPMTHLDQLENSAREGYARGDHRQTVKMGDDLITVSIISAMINRGMATGDTKRAVWSINGKRASRAAADRVEQLWHQAHQ